MGMNDPIADMLTRIRNACAVGHESVTMPVSKLKVAVAKVLKEEGFIRGFEVLQAQPQSQLKVLLAYREGKAPAISGLRRVSKPGLRIYTQKSEIPRVFGGLGIAVLSTSKGVMTGHQAWRQRLGGEVLCYVW
ncbi:MAG: 30S ribosomal protein S8 [Chloroflexi bacterium]|nr:30S ribosomal protein S8 [Chloroflexota bacterium]